jgi:hypothetical protein
MIYISYVYNNICSFVSNLIYFSPYEFITTIKNIPSMLFNSKINLISNIYSCFDINKIFGNIYKSKNIQNTEYINLNFKKRNYISSQQKKFRIMNYSNNMSNNYGDNDIEDNCDWGWFVAIDEFEVHRR